MTDLADAIKKLQAMQQRNTNDGMLTAFQGLLDEISVSLGELVDAAEKRPDHSKAVAESMANALKQMKMTTVNVEPTPVTVNVSPTPVTVEAVMPEGKAPVVNVSSGGAPIGATWLMKIPGTGAWPDRTVTITRTK